MAASPFFSGRIPQDLYDAVELHRKDSGDSRTDILVKALSTYINHPVDWPTVSLEAKQNDQRLVTVEKELQELNLKVHRLYEYIGGMAAQGNATAPNKGSKVQMELEGIVIKSDNKDDNEAKSEIEEADNMSDNKSDNTKPTKPGYDNVIPENAVFIGSLRAFEILALPGFKNQNAEKIRNKLRNRIRDKKTANTESVSIAIYPYFFSFTGQRAKSSKNGKFEAVWDVYELQKSQSFKLTEASDIPSEELKDYQEFHSQVDS